MANKLRFLLLVLVVLISFGLTNTTHGIEQLREDTDDLDRMNWGEDLPRDNAIAVKKYRKAANQGSVEAQFDLGSMYYSGQGVPQDYAEAVKWFRKAAQGGSVEAQYNLASMYYMGQGVPQDYGESVKWFRRVAEQGSASAQFNLGLMYLRGVGVQKNDTEAYAWWSIAAASGHQNAEKGKDEISEILFPEALAAARQRATELNEEIEARRDRQDKNAGL